MEKKKKNLTIFGGLATFGGSLLSGFIRVHNFLTLLKRRPYFGNNQKISESVNCRTCGKDPTICLMKSIDFL